MSIETKDLVKIYRKRRVVDGVNINVERGEVVGLLGPNGAGKTTTFYMVVGLIHPKKGKVMFDKRDISRLPMHKRARLGIGYLAQEPSVFRKLTVEENIVAIWQLRGIPKSLRKNEKWFKITEKRLKKLEKLKFNIENLIPLINNKEKKYYTKKELEEKLTELNYPQKQQKTIIKYASYPVKERWENRLEEILNEFHITHIRKSKGFQLSGGERRRVELARAMAAEPSFLLLDEPFSGIDPIAVGGIKDMIKLLKERNIGILLTDHNVRDTLTITDRAYILSDGKIIDQGRPDYIANSPLAQKYYLGTDFRL